LINAHLVAECERLRQTVKKLEQERDGIRQTLAAIQVERDVYLRSLYAQTRAQFQADDWRDFREEDYTITGDQLLAELEKL
jgi:hypothetical protein